MSDKRNRAVVTGITGQDGAYLTQLLLEKGYTVFGTYRRTSSVNFWRLGELGITEHPNLKLVEYDVTDLSSTIRLLEKAEPREVYNLAAQSFVGVSFEQPITTAEITGVGALNLLEAIRTVDPPSAFIRRRRRRCSVKYRPYHNRSRRLFTPQPLRGREIICTLVNDQLQGVLRHLWRVRHFVQSRIASERKGIRDAENHRCYRAHQTR